MLCWQHTRTGMTQYAVCGALALCVISLVVLVPVRLAAAAPRAQASSDCSASITVQLAGVRQTANGIVTPQGVVRRRKDRAAQLLAEGR